MRREVEAGETKTVDVELLGQLVNSMADAIEKLEKAKKESRITDSNKIKNFILDIQKKINAELT